MKRCYPPFPSCSSTGNGFGCVRESEFAYPKCSKKKKKGDHPVGRKGGEIIHRLDPLCGL